MNYALRIKNSPLSNFSTSRLDFSHKKMYNYNVKETAMSTSNRKYKDSVFVDLFSEDEKAKEIFLSLYNALHGTELNDTEDLKNIRLDQVLYMSFYNDVSYLVDNKIIVLAEHQSTINPNMPLRCLEYISRLYETLFESKEKYSRKLLQIPTPEFYIIHNYELRIMN